MRSVLPVLLALVGAGAGLGAGALMKPASDTAGGETGGIVETDLETAGHHALVADTGSGADEDVDGRFPDPHGTGEVGGARTEFVKLNNQFVVPVLSAGRVRSMVVVSLSLEAPIGGRERIYAQEPRIRDTLLQVLFDHANSGGFDGVFTNGAKMDVLRGELRRAGKQLLGADVVDVLVTDIARQDLG